MKKIVALLLAMLMMLNLSFAMAEDTFEENLAAFLNTLNVENGDLLLNAEAAGQAINVRAGKDEAGNRLDAFGQFFHRINIFRLIKRKRK